MYVYFFTSPTLKHFQIAINHRTWAVESIEEPHAWARLGRSRQMPIGAVGLFYCSTEPQVFTTPFIVESRPEDRAIEGVWEQPMYLPFSIRPLGDLGTQILFTHARSTWPTLKAAEDARDTLNLSPALAFTPTFIPRYDWDLILEQLKIDPEAHEELFSAAPGIVLEK
jgi:hypothetical protein